MYYWSRNIVISATTIARWTHFVAAADTECTEICSRNPGIRTTRSAAFTVAAESALRGTVRWADRRTSMAPMANRRMDRIVGPTVSRRTGHITGLPRRSCVRAWKAAT